MKGDVFVFKFMKSKSGITLMELIICVIILGILSAIAVPVYSGVSKKKKIQDCYCNRKIIETQVGQIMSGMFDNGKPQPVIPISNIYVKHQHSINKYDEDGKYIETVVESCVDNMRLNEHNELVDGFALDEETGIVSDKRDGICDVCGQPMEWCYNTTGHVNKTHIFYYDENGNTLHADNEYGFNANRNKQEDRNKDDETKADSYYEFQNSQNNENQTIQQVIYPSGFLRFDVATIGDIRGGYLAGVDYKTRCKEGYFLKHSELENELVSETFLNKELPRCPFDEDGKKGYFYYIAADAQVYCTCPYCSPYGANS